jgi:hypothetical protein
MWHVASKLNSPNAEFFYTQAWLNIVEDHRLWLREHEKTTTSPISPYDLEIYKGNFISFLLSKDIPHYLHWTILRMNNLVSPEQFDHNYKFFYVPSIDTIEQLRKMAMTSTQ